jgi:hypothetical protein
MFNLLVRVIPITNSVSPLPSGASKKRVGLIVQNEQEDSGDGM